MIRNSFLKLPWNLCSPSKGDDQKTTLYTPRIVHNVEYTHAQHIYQLRRYVFLSHTSMLLKYSNF